VDEYKGIHKEINRITKIEDYEVVPFSLDGSAPRSAAERITEDINYLQGFIPYKEGSEVNLNGKTLTPAQKAFNTKYQVAAKNLHAKLERELFIVQNDPTLTEFEKTEIRKIKGENKEA
jgi:hypothetical protein